MKIKKKVVKTVDLLIKIKYNIAVKVGFEGIVIPVDFYDLFNENYFWRIL